MRQLKITKSITNRDSAVLERYLSEIGREQMISAEEEVELARRIKAGDEAAMEKLVVSNLRFVVSVAKQYQNQGLDLQDLINEGNVGLIKAARCFDETRGFKFISYAVWWIRQGIQQAIAEQSRVVRLPVNKVGDISKIKKESTRLEQKLNRMPTIEEIADALDMPASKVAELTRLNNRPQSIDSPVSPDDDTAFVDILVHDNAEDTDKLLMRESLAAEIQEVLKTLPEKERQVLMLFYGIDSSHEHTLEEISDDLGMSRERVRQIKERALKRLRQCSKNKSLKSYL